MNTAKDGGERRYLEWQDRLGWLQGKGFREEMVVAEDAGAGQAIKYIQDYCNMLALRVYWWGGYCYPSVGKREHLLQCTRLNSDLYQGVQADKKTNASNQGLLVFSLCWNQVPQKEHFVMIIQGEVGGGREKTNPNQSTFFA